MYRVLDLTGEPVRGGFSKWRDADTFRISCGRGDWTIEEYDSFRLLNRHWADNGYWEWDD